MKNIILSFLIITIIAGLNILKAADTKPLVPDGNVFFTDDKGVKYFVCPVLGNQAVVDSTTAFSDFEGKRYFFCCPDCKGKFDKTPADYVKKLVLPANIHDISKDGTHFICPITGEIGNLNDKTNYCDYNSKRYYLCCPDCKPKFEKDPAKYAKALCEKMKKGNHPPSCKMKEGK
jgi:YHS domain-containing protein